MKTFNDPPNQSVVDTNGRPIAIVNAATESDAKMQLKCRDLWDSGWQVRESTAEDWARYVADLLGGRGSGNKKIHWFELDREISNEH